MTLKFIGAKPVVADIKTFMFEAEQPLTWKAGQFNYYTLQHDNPDERGIKRWFTISSAPSEKHITITTRIDADHGSSFKRALDKLRPGDTIEADGPEGDFVIEDPTRNYLWIAGGIGITPFRSILVDKADKKVKLNVHLLYANRSNEIAFKDTFDELQKKNPNLVIDYIVQPDRIDEKLLKTTISRIDNPYIYISGPEPMVEAMIEQIKGLGVSEDNIRGDYFPGYQAD
jgi:ferredoxin-NADP reductase